ncbi:hypothetical protein TanjilG_10735 [Lupinus angustifolius]|uniref:Uncharacterized protein n=1 Tax=Lupinus angustifolius TaxID=3871 RepID=A0A1J7HR69_LUPAN|nr:PREDICTED: uncharacterized protein LOC109342349 [Lupinus angustifolius]OIW15295.1 hypothetical protein TanjilG_10735 [Lupinus angustifolius]
MANFNNHHNHAMLLLLFLFLISSSSSYARLLNGVTSLVTTETTLNIALPSEGVFLKEKEELAGHVLPCDHMVVVTGKVQSPEFTLSGGKYGPLILNMLPKGKVPSSGPSKRINNVKN